MFDTHKTRMIGLPRGEEIVTTRYAVSIPERDGQMDRQTDEIVISVSRVVLHLPKLSEKNKTGVCSSYVLQVSY